MEKLMAAILVGAAIAAAYLLLVFGQQINAILRVALAR